MRGGSADHQGEPVGDSDLGTQPRYRFTRQPVKYLRHHNPGTRLSNPGGAARQPPAAARENPGSADSSRSSSPEPAAQRPPQRSDAHFENAHLPLHSDTAAESKMDVPLSPREVVQYMLGLDSTFASPATVTSSATTQGPCQEGAAAGGQAAVNPNLSGQSVGQSQAFCPSPKTFPTEHNLSAPAQKILSGLKLRRSYSGKDEQLFV